MAFLSNGEGFFPTPPQLEVIRAIQKVHIDFLKHFQLFIG